MGIRNGDGDGGGVDGDGSGALPRPGRVPEQRLSIPRISPLVAAVLRNFSWLKDGLFRVSVSEASYRRKGKVGGVPGAPHHALARPGLAHAK